MEGFADDVHRAADALERTERERDRAITESRRIIRLSKRTIHAIHTGEDPSDAASELQDAMDGLMSSVDPDVLHTQVIADAAMEFAEAMILKGIVQEGRVPSAEELGIQPSSWVLGLGDSIGELRRLVTSCLMDGDMEGANRHFSVMEEISGEFMQLDVPDAVAPVRRKQDIARGIMDRTRSDMTTASIMDRVGKL